MVGTEEHRLTVGWDLQCPGDSTLAGQLPGAGSFEGDLTGESESDPIGFVGDRPVLSQQGLQTPAEVNQSSRGPKVTDISMVSPGAGRRR